jgi:hypothetical protein
MIRPGRDRRTDNIRDEQGVKMNTSPSAGRFPGMRGGAQLAVRLQQTTPATRRQFVHAAPVPLARIGFTHRARGF